jgi:hypothetical protein
MSGGSHNYAYRHVEEFIEGLECRELTPARLAFRDHLKRVAWAMHHIEWVDSFDYAAGEEISAIEACMVCVDCGRKERSE